jgi:hypothetical protein
MSMWSVNENVESNDVWVIFQSHEDVSDISIYGYLIPEAAIPMICGGASFPFWPTLVVHVESGRRCYQSGTHEMLSTPTHSVVSIFVFTHFH